MNSPNQKESLNPYKPGETKEVMTLLRVTAIGLIFTLNPQPKNLQLVLDTLDQYEVPNDDSPESIRIQELLGNMVAHGKSHWEEITGKKYDDREPLSNDEIKVFFSQKSI